MRVALAPKRYNQDQSRIPSSPLPQGSPLDASGKVNAAQVDNSLRKKDQIGSTPPLRAPETRTEFLDTGHVISSNHSSEEVPDQQRKNEDWATPGAPERHARKFRRGLRQSNERASSVKYVCEKADECKMLRVMNEPVLLDMCVKRQTRNEPVLLNMSTIM